jgi:hypothetical protein
MAFWCVRKHTSCITGIIIMPTLTITCSNTLLGNYVVKADCIFEEMGHTLTAEGSNREDTLTEA